MTLSPLALATDGLFLPPGSSYTPEQIRAALGLPGPDLGARLGAIYAQLVADWQKGEDRYTRYLPGTTTVILDKAVVFDPETGFTVTQRSALPLPPDNGETAPFNEIRAALGLPGPDLGARLGAIYAQLVADWQKGEDRYTRYLPGTTTVILDKAVVFDPETGFTVTRGEE